MKKILYAAAFLSMLWSCKPGQQTTSGTSKSDEVQVTLDLQNVKDDKVAVTVITPKFTTEQATYHLPKIVPGTYSEDDYGRFIDDLKAYDAKGNLLTVTKGDVNTWTVSNAKALTKITYLVNDTYDIETTHEIFSPAGTNISPENYMINTHGFIGYFDTKTETPYQLTVLHPATLWGATSMTDTDASTTSDVFTTSRYAELVENPIMYAKPDYTTFTVEGMDILISVYSPNGLITAESITPEMKTMITAQKRFLGKFNATKKYSVLIYLSDMEKSDAHGFGALEHPTATTVVMPEAMPKDQLVESLKDIVSHEFFHIVTPLSIHSKEIQYFDYNNPKMSEHLWMYEGITEYFANLFQVNQGLITEDDFYHRMAEKIVNSKRYDDTMPFTKMSREVLKKPYKDAYANVYEKGALIAMCLDIQIRESSHGQRGILDLMQKLSKEYGNSKPFNDSELFAKVTELTYPEVGAFLDKYVAGNTPIPYDTYFAKMGVSEATTKVPENVFLRDGSPFITINPDTKEILFVPGAPLNEFFTTLGTKGGDILASFNGTSYNQDTIYEMIMSSENLKQNDPVTVTVKRNGKEIVLKGKAKLSMIDSKGLQATDTTKTALRESWLKG